MELLQIESGSGWQISDVLTLMSFGGGLLVIIIGWAVRMEIMAVTLKNKIQSNTDRDNDMVKLFTEKIDGLHHKFADLQNELHPIKEWITRRQAVEEDREKRS